MNIEEAIKVPYHLIQNEYAWTIHAYMRFANIDYTEENIHYMNMVSVGKVPVLQDGHKLIPNSDIISYLKENAVDLDCNISPEQQSDSLAFIALINDSLQYLYEYRKWQVTNNLTTDLWPYIKLLSFPYNFYYILTKSQSLNHELKLKGYTNNNENLYKLSSYLRTFETKLGYNNYIYGEKPSTLDAYLFGLIAQLQLSSSGLKTLLKDFDHLIRYYERIMKQYFSAAFGEEVSRNPWIHYYNLRISAHASSSDDCLPYSINSATPIEDNEWRQDEKKTEEKEGEEIVHIDRKSNRNFYLIAGGSILLYLLTIIDIEDFL
ncbi:hypothetical protein WA158_004564 [Blastocystis sp. Blastoise]